MLCLNNISKTYHGLPGRNILSNINLELGAGDYIAVMGESGVGKSTLLNLIAGLDTPDTGTVAIDGQDLNTLDENALTRLRRQKMGFVFQAFHILPHLTVAQNVALPLGLNGITSSETAHRVSAMLDAVGLNGRQSSRPGELSGGELQRVAIARALVHKPQLLLADEPTGNLDPETASQVLSLLRDQLKSTGATGILVTHSAAAAVTTDRVYALTSRGLGTGS